MKVDIHPPMGEVLRSWAGERVKSCQPRLCAEFEDVDDSKLFEALLEEILSWTANVLFIFVSLDDEAVVQITEKSNLGELLSDYIIRGITVTIVDPINGDGLTVDWEGFEDNGTDSEVLVVAWGEHESIAQNIVDKLRMGSVFRGN